MKRRAALALLLASPGFALGCGSRNSAPVVAAPPVMVALVEAQSVVEHIEAAGQLVAVDEASVAAEVGGRVTQVRVEEGAAVAAGDIVLEIDRERRQLELATERAAAAEAREAISRAERDLGRIRSLKERSAASQARLDAAETDLRQARARLAAAEARQGLAERAVQDASVAAPFAGLLARRYVSAGDFVTAGKPLFDLVALDPIEVEFNLAERDSGRVSLGDKVEVRVAPFPDEVFQATVHVISPRIDPATRTLRVKARLENSAGRLRPGLFARADLGVAERPNVPMLPEEAVLQRSDGAVAFVVGDDGRVQRRRIQIGSFQEGRVEAVEGLRVGERVVVRGQAQLVDGVRVDVREEDGAKPGGLASGAKPDGLPAGAPVAEVVR
jgi:membrane fusion protein (multidrug efflux system)